MPNVDEKPGPKLLPCNLNGDLKLIWRSSRLTLPACLQRLATSAVSSWKGGGLGLSAECCRSTHQFGDVVAEQPHARFRAWIVARLECNCHDGLILSSCYCPVMERTPHKFPEDRHGTSTRQGEDREMKYSTKPSGLREYSEVDGKIKSSKLPFSLDCDSCETHILRTGRLSARLGEGEKRAMSLKYTIST
jgi:hypothetical protein